MTADVMKVVGELEAKRQAYLSSEAGAQSHDALTDYNVSLAMAWPTLKSALEAAEAEATALREALVELTPAMLLDGVEALRKVRSVYLHGGGRLTDGDAVRAIYKAVTRSLTQSTALSEAGGKDE